MVVGEPGLGKTHLARQVEAQLSQCVYGLYTGSAKTCLIEIAEGLGIPTTNEKGKAITSDALKDAIAQNLDKTILICDNIQRWPSSLKFWVERLVEEGRTVLLLGTRRDLEGVSFKMPRLKLARLTENETKLLVRDEAIKRSLRVAPKELNDICIRSAGNPMLAKRLLDEYESGVEDPELQDASNYLDISPMIMAELAMIGAVRFMGMALNDKSLYIIGGLGLTAFVALRYIRAMLPKEDRRK